MRRFSEEQVTLIASRARALGEPARVRMLETLARADQPVGQLAAALRMQQSTASKHLQVLFHAGLVQRRRVASTVVYSIADAELVQWCRYLGARQLTAPADAGAAASRV
jgi:ArsR family transcriptional regulator